MPVYEYVAIDARGKKTRGNVDADSERQARQKLRGQKIYPTELHESIKAARSKSRDVRKYFKSDRVASHDLTIATRQLATLVGAGLPLVEALKALAEQTDSPVLKRIIIDVRENVEEGLSLAKSLATFPRSFPRLYINMVAAGEASGTLDSVLNNLADYLESQLALRRKVRSALFYPILMLIICTVVVVVLLTAVVPRVIEIFEKQGATLPVPTQILLGISNTLTSYWYFFIALIALALYALSLYYKKPEGRHHIDELVLNIPYFGGIVRKVNAARIASTLGTLVASGVELLRGLDIAKNISNNVLFQEALASAREGVKEGRGLANELGRSNVFPNMMCRMIAVGEKSGQLEGMLQKASDTYQNEVDATLSGLTSVIEPIMMIIVGIIVLCIVISVLLPMIDLINIVQP